MKYNILGYFIGEGFRNVLKNKKSTTASLVVMCLTMIMFGIFFTISKNIEHIVTELEHSQGIQVFLDVNATDDEVKKAEQDISKITGVNTIKFVSKEEALNIMKERLKNTPKLLKGFDKDIFKASYVVTFTDLSLSSTVQEQIKQLDNVVDITSKDDTVNALMNIGKWIRVFTAGILIVLIVFSVFIIANTIKLTVHARRKEISIMKYVGATNNFIRSPFIVEGILIGIVSGIIALLVVGLGYNAISDKLLQTEIFQNGDITLVGFNEMFSLIIIVYVILGIGIGIIGSTISMRKYLQV